MFIIRISNNDSYYFMVRLLQILQIGNEEQKSSVGINVGFAT
jgi:hypothetical protein